jgi:sugar phosphate isomerase/epimerase
MRFGINTLQREILFPSGLSPEETFARVASLDHAKVAAELSAHGFGVVEISGDMAIFLPHTLAPQAIEGLAEVKESTDLSYTVHLPLWSVEPSTPLAAVREGSLKALVGAIQATLPLQPEVFVLHATGALAAEFYHMDLPALARNFTLRQFQSNARETIQKLLRETDVSSRRIAIETIEFPYDLTLELAEDLDLSICLDTGHILAGFSGPIGLQDALERCLPRLAEIHLHDAPWQGPAQKIVYGQDHRPLGTGDLDILGLLDRLIEADFDGPTVFELTIEEAVASLEVIRAIRPAALGTPAPNVLQERP